MSRPACSDDHRPHAKPRRARGPVQHLGPGRAATCEKKLQAARATIQRLRKQITGVR